MAKMFYTLEEAAEKLGKSSDEVKALVKSGQLQEFRDRDRLMFKRDQVDLLSGAGDGISLEDDLEPISLASSGSGSAMRVADDAPKEGSGISIFDVTEEADENSKTVVSSTASSPDFAMDPASSGSGLMNLTREADDTGLGEDLIKDVYGQGDQASPTPTGDLFESSGVAEPAAAAAPLMMAVAPIQGGASGLACGLAIGSIIACLAACALLVMALTGIGSGGSASGGAGDMFDMVAKNLMPIAGGLAGCLVVFGLLGFVIGKKTG
ncbi:MAG: helix-turn-helix domain-containing protein [Phycisphaerales bacterium]|nr:helix-turn-helix domain-containing protein [Phycisphaerales bacterium]